MRFACQCEQLAETLSKPGSSGVEAVSEQQAREIAAVKRGAALLNVLLFHVYPLRCVSGIAFCQGRFSGLQGWCSIWGAQAVIPLVAYSKLSVPFWVQRAPFCRRFMPFPEPRRPGTTSAGC